MAVFTELAIVKNLSIISVIDGADLRQYSFVYILTKGITGGKLPFIASFG
jgi:hypothetical protein